MPSVCINLYVVPDLRIKNVAFTFKSALSCRDKGTNKHKDTNRDMLFFSFLFPFFLGGGGRERIVNFFYLLLLFLRK